MRILTLVAILSIVIASAAPAQDPGSIAIIPSFHAHAAQGGGPLPLVRLTQERFIVALYRNAVAVRAEGEFTNPEAETLDTELSLPSAGHDENGDAPGGRRSNGLFDVQLRVEGERVAPELLRDGDGDRYAVRLRIAPGESRTVEALFWAQTSLAGPYSLPGLDTAAILPGQRAFLIDLSHAAAWSGSLDRVDVSVLLRGGLTRSDIADADPDTYVDTDSTLRWTLLELEPTDEDNVELTYAPHGPAPKTPDTMARLSSFIVRHVYDDLLERARHVDDEDADLR